MYFESGAGHNKITDLYANITVNELKVKKFKKRQSDFFRKIMKKPAKNRFMIVCICKNTLFWSILTKLKSFKIQRFCGYW